MTDQVEFALKLHRVAVPDPEANACWSPFSLASALALAHEAARGETRAELGALLGNFRGGDAQDISQLAIANTLWADDRLPLNPDFPLTDSVRRADFSDAVTVRKLVNADVEETTRGLISDLLDRVRPGTVAILVNALYLKVSWQTAFPAHSTELRPFRGPGGVVEVPTMRLTAGLGYTRHPGWQTIALPTKRPGLEALVLLPDTSLEQPLDPSVFRVEHDVQVRLSLPKVDVRAKFELSETLPRLGVAELFTARADLTGLSPDRSLFVSEVIHEAVLRIDERGLEGAAATAVVMARGARRVQPRDPIVVEVDRPFLLAVRNTRTRAIYFMAQVARP